jgi:hypothetical protein
MSDTLESRLGSEAESKDEIDEVMPRSISVAVTKMPETPSKPLLNDSTRLLSLAAFLLSLVTGGYATYSVWKTHQESTIGDVNKLIDQYFKGQEKLKTINTATDLPFYNLLRTELRSEAEQAVKKALSEEKKAYGDVSGLTLLANPA